ncbi:MAG: sugar ABC transporter substrate-binding protein [Alicyclobacillus sp.]|nr:sugar ABC transporter substrate-binding protein [Alicyclobacillus sp.]
MRHPKMLRSILGVGVTAGMVFAANPQVFTQAFGATKATTTIYLQMWQGPEGNAMRPVVNEWNQTMAPKTGITIQYTLLSRNGYADKLTSQLLSKNPIPDIVYPFNWFIPQYAKAGVLTPLNSYIQKDKAFDVKDFFPAALQTGQFEGKQYGIPIDMSEPVLFYRKDLIKKPPQTWDQALALAKKFSQSTNPKSPTPYGTTLYAAAGFAEPAQLWEEVFWAYGGSLLNSKGLSNINTPAGIKATQYGVQLVKQKLVPPDYNTYEYPQVESAMQAGKVAFVQEWNAAWADFSNKNVSPLIYNKVAYAPIPGAMIHGKLVRYYHVHTITLAINAASQHKQEAWEVLSWLAGKQGALQYTLNGGATPRASVFYSPQVKAKYGNYYSFLATEVKKYGRTEPPLVDMVNIDQNIMNKALNAAWSGQQTPEQALAQAQAQIDAVIKQSK